MNHIIYEVTKRPDCNSLRHISMKSQKTVINLRSEQWTLDLQKCTVGVTEKFSLIVSSGFCKGRISVLQRRCGVNCQTVLKQTKWNLKIRWFEKIWSTCVVQDKDRSKNFMIFCLSEEILLKILTEKWASYLKPCAKSLEFNVAESKKWNQAFLHDRSKWLHTALQWLDRFCRMRNNWNK